MPVRLGAALTFAMAIGSGAVLARAESPTALVGGLTAPAVVTPGPNRLASGGFEPSAAAWSDGPGSPMALTSHSNSNIKAKVRLVNGKGFVLAYNASGSRQSATFTWSTVPGTVRVHGEARGLVATGRSFTDTFAPFAAHVYVVESGLTGAK